jgi:hypothetical protein
VKKFMYFDGFHGILMQIIDRPQVALLQKNSFCMSDKLL